MIIDIILDRREGAINYDAATHLKAIYDYATFFHMNNLAAAVDGGTEDDVKAALMDYVISGGCNPDIHHHNFLDLCLFIKAVRWTEKTEILLSVTYGTGLPAAQAEAIEDALISAVKALPFSPDDIFRGTGDGTREYTALFTI